jgi:tRNA modification GTPase
LSDGAGLDSSDGENVVEREGVRRARAYLEEAALVIWLDDGSRPPPQGRPPVAKEKLVGVVNKRDLPLASGWEAVLEAEDNLWLSAKTGEGVDKLVEELVRRATTRGGDDERALSLSARERRLLEEAADALARVGEHVRSSGVEELGAEELRLASDALGRIVGAIDIDEVYGEIFSRFCIGK